MKINFHPNEKRVSSQGKSRSIPRKIPLHWNEAFRQFADSKNIPTTTARSELFFATFVSYSNINPNPHTMRRFYSLIAAMMIACVALFAQDKKAEISFKKTTHDFGTFAEELGNVTTEFEFTNTGNAPLLITRTAASCGCTTPEYPREPIAPGKSGVIKVTYSAKGRPGVFQKTVYVFANTDPEKSTLIIKGKVNPEPPSKENNYPKAIGDLRLTSKYIPFFDVYPGTTKTETIDVYNPTNSTLHITFTDLPKHLKAVASPASLGAQKEGKISVTYDAEKAKDWGPRKDNIQVVLNGAKSDDNIIALSADIREDFSKLTNAQHAKAPVAELDKTEVSFGKLSTTASQTIVITNTGKQNLIVRKVVNDNSAISVSPSKATIAPGKSATITLTCNAKNATKRNLSGNLTIITNDPERSTINVHFTAVIN